MSREIRMAIERPHTDAAALESGVSIRNERSTVAIDLKSVSYLDHRGRKTRGALQFTPN